MAISRDKKNTLVAELDELFKTSKGSAAAAYQGLSVADMQALRAEAREKGVTIKVVKNRLVRVVLAESETFKKADSSLLTGQLVYAFSADDEVVSAQVLANFSKTHPELKLIAGFDAMGTILDQASVTALANLPTKDQLKGQLLSVFTAPLSRFMSVANGAQRGFAQVASARAEQL